MMRSTPSILRWPAMALLALLLTPASGQNALSFDGVNDGVSCPGATLNITGTQITLEAWIYPTTFKAQPFEGSIINKEGTSAGYELRCGGAGILEAAFGTGGGFIVVTSPASTLTLNTWQHVAVTYNGTNARLHKNGVQVASVAGTAGITSSASTLRIGDYAVTPGTRVFAGKIDEVRVWNVARSATDITGSQNQELCGSTSGLVAAYSFNQGTAGGNNAALTTLLDATANANHGTLSGFALSGSTSNWVTGQTGLTTLETPASVGGAQAICPGSTTSGLGGSTPTTGTGSWSVVSGGTGTFNPNNTTPNATFTHLTGTGPITLRWTIASVTCGPSADVLVTLIPSPTIASVTATPASICSGGNSQLQVNLAPPSYCATSVTYPPVFYSELNAWFQPRLTWVTIAGTTLNNATGGEGDTPGYTLYPASGATTATLVAGNTYTMTVSSADHTTPYLVDDVVVWIDYNNNGLFEEPSEKLDHLYPNASVCLSFQYPAGPSSNCTTDVNYFNFTVPTTAHNGPVRMRVRAAQESSYIYEYIYFPETGYEDVNTGMVDQGVVPPCGNLTEGEVEDYTITMTGGADPFLSYSWSPATYLNSTTIAAPMATGITTAETYTVSVCSGASTGTVAISFNTADTDADGTIDCNDACPADPNKIAAGTCGCGAPEPGAACNDNNANTTNDVITAGCICAGTPTAIMVAARLFLEGPYVSGTGLMNDALRTLGTFPLTDPYPGLGYVHTGSGNGGSVAPAVIAAGGNDAVVDWVLLELRSTANPATILASRSCLVQRDGDVVDLDGTSPVSFAAAAGNYHVAARHRNHLGCMTNAPVALSTSPAAVNFTTSATATYGTAARKSVSGTVAAEVLWAGDVTFNGELKYTGSGNDRDPILVTVGSTTPNNVVSNTYSTRDVNMNGEVKYTGSANDRDPILVNVGSTTPNNVRVQQLP